VTMLISDIMNVIVSSKKAILVIWNKIHFQISKIIIFTSTNWIVDIKNRHFN